ncbi:Transmembrane protein 154 [Sciurus carolinensis]|uniref:Transmembrane protein 154 n=1 Tax=Sciurus carolinensis TaxID=30640 RepID=A0AA41N4Q8_SCICA|nr:Transmembrane protein 154 [Sciurus carolinensis]
MTAPRAALVFALGLVHARPGKRPPAGKEDPKGLWCRQLQDSAGNCEELEQSGDTSPENNNANEETTSDALAATTTEIVSANTTSIPIAEDADQLEFILMVLIPLISSVLLLLSVVLLVKYCRRKRTKQGELGSENLKVPIFEEDTPSVMEIEMEELDKWMNSMNRNGITHHVLLAFLPSWDQPPVLNRALQEVTISPSGMTFYVVFMDNLVLKAMVPNGEEFTGRSPLT